MFLSTTDYPSGQIIEFNIESSKDGKNKDIKAINDELTLKPSPFREGYKIREGYTNNTEYSTFQ